MNTPRPFAAALVLLAGATSIALSGAVLAPQEQEEENGVIYSTKEDGGNLYTENEYANFVLRFEFRLTPNANNTARSTRSRRPGADFRSRWENGIQRRSPPTAGTLRSSSTARRS